MRGITEERLREISKSYSTDSPSALHIKWLIRNECQEINQLANHEFKEYIVSEEALAHDSGFAEGYNRGHADAESKYKFTNEQDLILAAEKYADVYDGDERQDIKTDVLNAFYHGSHYEKVKHQWKDISSAPKDGREILLHCFVDKDCPLNDTGLCYWDEDKNMWTWGLGNEFRRPTHWMELPNPPEEK